MTYSHYHMHVIPVYETDERARPARVLSWSEGVVMYDDAEAREVSGSLARHWPGAGEAEASGLW
jgi:diadenosine tetraphosphate (Ap4A) HIT family hydrolase